MIWIPIVATIGGGALYSYFTRDEDEPGVLEDVFTGAGRITGRTISSAIKPLLPALAIVGLAAGAGLIITKKVL